MNFLNFCSDAGPFGGWRKWVNPQTENHGTDRLPFSHRWGHVTIFSHKKQQFFLCLALQAFIRLKPHPVKKMFWKLLSSSFGIKPLLPWLPQVLSPPLSYSFFTLCLLMGEGNRPLWNDNKKVYIGLFQKYVPPANLSIPVSIWWWG